MFDKTCTQQPVVRKDINLLFLAPTAVMVRSFGSNPLQTMLRNIFKEALSIIHISKTVIRRHFQKIVFVLFPHSERFEQLCQGELRRAATFFAPFLLSCDQYFFFSLSLCYKRIGSCFSCASIELWMHLGSLESTREARVVLGYRLKQLLRFPRALQTFCKLFTSCD